MLMVIFGAGASYDCVSSRPPTNWPPEHHPYRLPLANQLFDDRGIFNKWINNFPKCKPIIPYLREASQNGLVERELEKLQAQGVDYPDRYRQIAAVQFYLQCILWECEVGLKKDPGWSVTNYVTLLDQIESWRKTEPVCLTTFNYDTMLENALRHVGVNINGLQDYISSENYKIIKLHGSIDWAHSVVTLIEEIENRDGLDVANELIERANNLDIRKDFNMVKQYPSTKKGEVALFPALAIPVETKQNYECPLQHLDVLNKVIPKVTKILLIGWHATETHFVQLLGEKLPKDVHVMTVSGSKESAEASNIRLKDTGIRGDFVETNTGFSDFVVRREIEEFLSR